LRLHEFLLPKILRPASGCSKRCLEASASHISK
jgi:hypothetical protein